MIALGSGWWLDATGAGWVLIQVGLKAKARTIERYGPFTSPRHAMQQRQVRLPKGAMGELVDLVEAGEAGDEMVGRTPHPVG